MSKIIKNKPRSHYTLVKNNLIKIAGVSYLNNEYHFFDLHSPFGKEDNFYVVGHGVSKDTVLSKNLDDAIYPTLKLDKDGVEDCSSIVIDNKIYLFYIANTFSIKDEKNINKHDLQSIESVSIFVCFSNDGYTFDNENNKKLLLTTEDIKNIGFDIKTVEAITTFIHPSDNNVYVALIGLKDNVRSIASFRFNKEDNTLTYLNVGKFIEDKYRVTSLSICEIIESINDDLMITCSVTKNARQGAYYITKHLDENSRSYCLLGNFDTKTGLFSYHRNTKSRYDLSEDMTSIRVSLDNRNRLISYGCIPTDYQFGKVNSSTYTRGMLSLPRRITYDNSGKFEFSVHPMIDIVTTNEMSFDRIKKTHFPIKATVSLGVNDHISFGNLRIVMSKDTLDINRSLCNIEMFYRRRNNYSIPTNGKTRMDLLILFDENIVEIIINNDEFLTLAINNLGNLIEYDSSMKNNVKVYSMNHVKNND